MKHSEALANLKRKQQKESRIISETEIIVKRELRNYHKNWNGSINKINKKLSIIQKDIRKISCRPILIFLSGALISAGVMWLFLHTPKSETFQHPTTQQEQ